MPDTTMPDTTVPDTTVPDTTVEAVSAFMETDDHSGNNIQDFWGQNWRGQNFRPH